MGKEVSGQIILLLITIFGIYVLFGLYTSLLSKMTLRSLEKRIAKGKIDDKQLIRLYETTERNKGNHFVSFFVYGIFYKSHIRMQEEINQLYRNEMKKRNLL